jgi:hypothetical protein
VFYRRAMALGNGEMSGGEVTRVQPRIAKRSVDSGNAPEVYRIDSGLSSKPCRSIGRDTSTFTAASMIQHLSEDLVNL